MAASNSLGVQAIAATVGATLSMGRDVATKTGVSAYGHSGKPAATS